MNVDSARVLVKLQQGQLQVLGNAVARLGKAMGDAQVLLQRWIGPKKVGWAARFVRNKLDLDDIKDVSPYALIGIVAACLCLPCEQPQSRILVLCQDSI